MKWGFLVLTITGAMALSAFGAAGTASGKWAFEVDPALRKGAPSFTGKTEGSAAPISVLVTAMDAKSSKPLVRESLGTTSTFEFNFPAVKTDTFVEATVTSGASYREKLFTWRTLLRPHGDAIINYQGQKELLPPPDFDDYWKKARQQLAEVPLSPRIEYVADKETSTGLLYRVELPSVDTRIVCWLYVPISAYGTGGKVVKKFPAVILVPGYGGESGPQDRTREGFITLSVNPRNHGPSRQFWKSPVDQLAYNITDPENFYFRMAYLDCLRAAQYLFTREEIDPKCVGVEGASQGGLFALALAALEPRIACVCSNVTAFSDFPDGMLLATAGHHTQYKRMLANHGTTPSLIRRSLAYIDGANMATRVKCPVQVNMTGQDHVSPYVCGVVVHNRLPKGVVREINVDPVGRHEVTPLIREWNRKWQSRWLMKSESSGRKGKNGMP